MAPKFADVADLPEDDRIRLIGEYCQKNPGKLVGVVTDAEPGKLDRYVAKLTARFPKVREVDRFDGPTAGSVTARVTADP